jgi:CheY-like chemotaxis protein
MVPERAGSGLPGGLEQLCVRDGEERGAEDSGQGHIVVPVDDKPEVIVEVVDGLGLEVSGPSRNDVRNPVLDQRLFEIEGVKLTFATDALSAIAKRAIKRKTGARGLRSIMEDILLDTMFELPGMDGVEEVVVNEEAVKSGAKPLLIFTEAPKVKEKATAS